MRFGESASSREEAALRAMSDHPLPSPRVLFWDESDASLGTLLFVSEFINGTSPLPSMIAGNAWAIDVYIDTTCEMQAINAKDLPPRSLNNLGLQSPPEMWSMPRIAGSPNRLPNTRPRIGSWSRSV